VPNEADVEDLLQEVFYELVEANRLLMPIDYVTGWLFVSRAIASRTSSARRGRRTSATRLSLDEDGELLRIEDLLPSPDAGPEALYVRSVLLDELESALSELPAEQRQVFVAHELEGRSFKELSAESGVSVNTLLSRKRYAVLHLRQRLQSIHDEFMRKVRNTNGWKHGWIKRNKWIFFVAPLGVAVFIAIWRRSGDASVELAAAALFGWRQITFWQALGLLVLCRILFGRREQLAPVVYRPIRMATHSRSSVPHPAPEAEEVYRRWLQFLDEEFTGTTLRSAAPRLCATSFTSSTWAARTEANSTSNSPASCPATSSRSRSTRKT
jgi:RNA polymerase sigma factor (sigma-70 family)